MTGAPAPVVSVLTTAYNRRQFVGEAIASVLASTFQDFELIVVDDHSTDGTFEVAQAFEARDPRVRVMRNERNLGDYANRNRAASFARGRYLKYLDSDDILYPHGLEVMVRAMEQFPDAVAGISVGDAQHEAPYPIRLLPGDAYEEHFFRRGILYMGPSACIYRTEPFRASGGFAEVRFDGDAIATFRLARLGPIVKIAPGLFWWREHAGQEIRFGGHHILKYGVLRDALEHPECPLAPARREEALEHISHLYGRQLLAEAIKRRRVGHALSLFRDSRMPVRYLLKGLVRPR